MSSPGAAQKSLSFSKDDKEECEAKVTDMAVEGQDFAWVEDAGKRKRIKEEHGSEKQGQGLNVCTCRMTSCYYEAKWLR